MKQARTNTVKCARKAAGALAPTNQNNAVAIKNTSAVVRADAGAPVSPCFGGGAGFAAGLAGAAATFGAGAGQVTAPSLITVRPRIASSSMLTLITPSLVLQSSSARRNRLVE